MLSHPVLWSKPDAHRMYAQDQVVIHMARMWIQKTIVFIILTLLHDYCLYREDYINSLVEQQWKTPTLQAIDRGQHMPLQEVFIIEVYLISSF
jgi:hypothetical protein